MRYRVKKAPKSLNKGPKKEPELKGIRPIYEDVPEYVSTGDFAAFEKMVLDTVSEPNLDEIAQSEHHHHHRHHHHGHHHHHSVHQEHSESHSESTKPTKKEKPKKKGKAKKIIISILLILILAAAGVGGYLYYQYRQAMNNPKASETYRYTDEELGIDPRVAEELKGYRNIVLYGLDNNKRSDVILLVSIDKETHQGKLTTIYRDTYMQLNPDKAYTIQGKERDFFKCNHAYWKGGMLTSMKMLNRHLDLNIRECVGFDWAAVASLVDELGGIDVDMTDSLLAYMNQGREQQLTRGDNGLVHLKGDEAVSFLRTRKDPGSDAATRSMRNMHTFLDLFERAKTMKKEDLLDLFKKTVTKVETDMPIPAMLGILKDVRSYELVPISGWPYNYKILWDDAYYYYVPDSLTDDVSAMHFRMFDQAEYEPTETCKQLSDKIDSKKGKTVK